VITAMSVVIPSYQRAHVLGRAISSVLQQTFRDFELLVVDDGSTDGTAAVVGAFDDERLKRITVPHRGRSQARNEGIARTNGHWVVFLDSDDEVGPMWLEELHNAIHDESVAVVCCGARIADHEDAQTGHIMMPRCLGPAYTDRIGLFRAGTFAVRRDVLSAVGGYEGSLAFAENSELALRVTAHCDRHGLTFANVYRPLVKIVRTRSALSEVDLWSRLHATELLLQRHGARYRRAGAAAYATHHAIAGTHALRLGLFGRATRHFLAAVAAHPAGAIHWGRLGRALAAPFTHRFSSHAQPALRQRHL
jgi:glycosyltransferase involved in cell wall biosynthesis